jgi:hypothetical protein
MEGEMLNFLADHLAGSFTPHLWPSATLHTALSPPAPCATFATQILSLATNSEDRDTPGNRSDPLGATGGEGTQ